MQQTFIELDDLQRENNLTIIDYQAQLDDYEEESPSKNKILHSIEGLRNIM